MSPGHLPHTSCMQTLTLQQRQEVPRVALAPEGLAPNTVQQGKECPPGHSLGEVPALPDGDTGPTPQPSPHSPINPFSSHLSHPLTPQAREGWIN